ncbi:hypothetical protein GCK72_001923 [Caenorhabditis remanei]|uniref:Uncharacterized protein n=1 Tax=Caenorhabditis remanei TaxID=31234 RepID=A0A6A5HR69_CAERE|nr:hypothetical protein GCK72_001923 [Caenorhabditis remanei]KAF1770105.1 hypothetical protein GCK72_001923 [Caenorhabditis remanei]
MPLLIWRLELSEVYIEGQVTYSLRMLIFIDFQQKVRFQNGYFEVLTDPRDDVETVPEADDVIDATPEDVGDDVDCSDALQSAYPEEPDERERMSS